MNSPAPNPTTTAPQSAAGGTGKTMLGLRIPDACMVYRVPSDLTQIAVGDQVVLQVRDGELIGSVLHVFTRPVDPFPGPIRKVIRRVTEKDQKFQLWRVEQERKAQLICREKIREMQLVMKLTKVTYLPGGGRAVIHFTSEARVDFRELVRVLSAELKVRVEMRHVGVRDESKLLCGLGSCGKTLCCSEFLTKFHPVSVRMAKNQDLSLTPEGISGVCGRLMCCLAYENEAYLCLRKNMPKVKSRVTLKDGREGTVRAVLPMQNEVELQFGDGAIEKMTTDKLVGEYPESCEKPGALTDETPVASMESDWEPKPEKSARIQEPVRARRGTPPNRKPSGTAPPPSREPTKRTPPPPSAPPAPKPEEALPDGSTEAAGKKRPPARRKRRGGAKPGVTPPSAAATTQSAAAPPPTSGVADASTGSGTTPSARPPGASARRRRRRSTQRRGGEGGENAPPATEG